LWRTVLPDGGCVTNEYFATGELKKTYGVRTYPVEYAYTDQGRLQTLKTWRNYAGNSGTAITTWKYDGYRGFMTNKVYDDGNGPSYTYTSAGRLKSRTWARGVGMTNTYNSAGDVAVTTYSDGTSRSNVIERTGRTVQVQVQTNVATLTYSPSGILLKE